MDSQFLISIIISAIVAIVQLVSFWINRGEKKEIRDNQLAKIHDVSELKQLHSILETKVIILHTNIEVLREKVENEINKTSRSLDKLDEKLDEVLKCHRN